MIGDFSSDLFIALQAYEENFNKSGFALFKPNVLNIKSGGNNQNCIEEDEDNVQCDDNNEDMILLYIYKLYIN